MSTTRIDPYAPPVATSRRQFLYALNPLAKIVAVAPAMVLLVFVRDLATPTAFLLLGYALILVGSRLTPRILLILLVAVPVGMLAIGFGFSLWVDAALVDDTVPALRIGAWTLFTGALEIGFATALRLGAIIALALVGGLTTTGPDLVRASVQQLRVPYRIGYTALAAFRFVPRFGSELSVIRDDGAAVYLNGVEVWRSNLPPGPLTADTYAAVSLWGADERDPTMVPIDPALLGEGTNSIAVEVHNDTRRGGDLSFDAELTVTR